MPDAEQDNAEAIAYLARRIAALEENQRTLYSAVKAHDDKLESLRPTRRNCRHCGKLVGMRDRSCGACSKPL